MKSRILTALVAAMILAGTGASARADIIYLGQDPTFHFPVHPEGAILAANAVRFVGGSLDPAIGLFPAEGESFASAATLTLDMLVGQGFTNITVHPSATLTSLDLSPFDVLYMAPSKDDTQLGNYLANAAKIAAYTAAGGGLVVEPDRDSALSWSWVPEAALIGHSGPTIVGREVVVLDPSAPAALTAGLTSEGLSEWSYSIHTTFATPGAGGFSVFASEGPTGLGVNLFKVTGAVAVPEPASLIFLAVGCGVIALAARRRQLAA